MKHPMPNSIKQQIDHYYILWREMIILYEDWARARGLSYNSLLVLYFLYDHRQGCTQKDICNYWLLPKQTVNTLLKEFSDNGYLVFTASDTDKRSKILRLTQAGETYAAQIIPSLQEVEAAAMSRMGEARGQALLENTELYIEYFRAAKCEKKF